MLSLQVMHHSLVFLIFFVVFGSQDSYSVEECKEGSITKPQTMLLKEDLLSCGYEKAVSQYHQNGKKTNITVDLMLRSFSVDDMYSSIYLHGWIFWTWTDARLTWNPSQYGDLKLLRVVNSETIWHPSVVFHTRHIPVTNVVGGHSFPSGKCNINNNGIVQCVTTKAIDIGCSISDFYHWPYHTLNCYVILYISDQDVVKMDVRSNKVDMRHYQENPEWILKSASIWMYTFFSGTSAAISRVGYTIQLQRRFSFYQATLIFPALVFAILVLITFWFDVQDEIRIKISCVNVMCHCLQLQYLASLIQIYGSEDSILVLLYRDSLIFTGVSTITTIFLQVLIKLNTVPSWMIRTKAIILGCRPIRLLLEKLKKKDVAVNEVDIVQEDEDGLVKTLPIDAAIVWALIGKLLDRVLFVSFSIVYFKMMYNWFI